MESLGDKLRGLALAVGVHALAFALLFLGLAWTQAARPVSVPGPIIEAMLVSYTPPPSARVPIQKPQPPRPKPEPAPPVPPPDLKPVRPEPPAPPRAQDTRDQERVDRESIEPARAEREQEERRKREQELLEQQQRLTQMERERQQQLEDIRRRREQAERQRKLEEQRLAQLEDLDRPQPARPDAPKSPQPAVQAGSEGEDDSLRARYAFELQQAVTSNWLRPDTAMPGLHCTVRIVQIPGGEVLSASVVAPCNGDELTRRSLEAAVLRAQPLPYRGFEPVFQREISFNFRYDG